MTASLTDRPAPPSEERTTPIERDPSIEALRATAAIEEALVALRHAVDTLAPAVNRAMRLDGRRTWTSEEYEAGAHTKNGYGCVGQAIDWLVSAHWKLTAKENA